MINNDDYLKNIYEKYDKNKNVKNDKFYNKEFKTRKLNFSKIAATFVLVLGLTAGINYAFPFISNKIQKNPKTYSIGDTVVSEEEKINLINEEEATEQVKRILEKLSYQEYNLEELKLSKDPRLGDIYWVAKTEKYTIEINATNGEFVSFSNDGFDDTKIKAEADKSQAEQALQNIREYLNIPDDYKIAKLDRHTITDDTCLWQADLCKEYDGVFNWYQDVRIIFVPEVEKIRLMRFFNYPFDNNEVVLTSEDALKVVMIENGYDTNEDLTVEFAIEQLDYNYTENQSDIVENDVMIPVEETKQISLETEEDMYKYLNSFKNYKASKIVRKVWKVTDLTFGKTDYYVDATTGEIISVGEYGLIPPGIQVDGKEYSAVQDKDELYENKIAENDLGKELLTLDKNDAIVEFNEKYDGAKVYEFLPANSDSIIIVDRNGRYKLFKFDRFSKMEKNSYKNILDVYNISDAYNVDKVEITKSIISNSGPEDYETKNVTNVDSILAVINRLNNLQEVNKDYHYKNIQQYYTEDSSPYKIGYHFKVKSKNGTYFYFEVYSVSGYLEGYSKYYKLSDEDIEFFVNLYEN